MWSFENTLRGRVLYSFRKVPRSSEIGGTLNEINGLAAALIKALRLMVYIVPPPAFG
jgi:hypothetical protein